MTTPTWETLAAKLIETLAEIDDPVERYQASRRADVIVETGTRGIRQQLVLELKHERGKTWREVGELLGGISPQRAEQIAKGR